MIYMLCSSNVNYVIKLTTRDVALYLDKYVLTLESLFKNLKFIFLIHLFEISHLTRFSARFSYFD